jgi:D-arabinose 5-phosphate isomerase GutQ
MTLSNSYLESKIKNVINSNLKAISTISFDMNLFSEIISSLIHSEGHIFTVGVGTSGIVAQRFAHLLSCSGLKAISLDAVLCLHGSLGAIGYNDIVYLISKGGDSSELDDLVSFLYEKRIKCIFQTENIDSKLISLCDTSIVVSYDTNSDLLNSIATGSSIVNSIVGDIICSIIVEIKNQTNEDLRKIHPRGAVGKRLKTKKILKNK